MSRHTESIDESSASHSVQWRQISVGVSLLATALALSGCHPSRHEPVTSSSWTDYRPTDAGKAAEFVAATNPGHFKADLPQDTYPGGPNGPIYITITPEAAVNRFNVKDPFGPGNRFRNAAGRVMARIELKDTKNDYACLKQGKSDEYVVWWVETQKTTDVAQWTSHYYLVDPTHGSESVTECGAPLQHSFMHVPEPGYSDAPPLMGGWNKHWWPPIHPITPDTLPRYGTWVSCSGGCCNGR